MEYYMGYHFEVARENSDFYNVFVDGEPLVTGTARMKYRSALDIYHDGARYLKEGVVIELVKFKNKDFNSYFDSGYGEVKKSNKKENIKEIKYFKDQC